METHYEFDLVVYIGRFQPKHKAHHHNGKKALELGKHVLIIIGSSGEKPKVDNPFTFNERKEMFLLDFTPEEKKRITILPSEDWLYEELKWKTNIINHAHNVCLGNGLDKENIALIGYNKDDSSYYLQSFPCWEYVEMPLLSTMSSTETREYWYHTGLFGTHEHLSRRVSTYIHDNKDRFSTRFDALRLQFFRNQSSKNRSLISQTVDAMVIRRSPSHTQKILLVKRSDDHTLAFPGGYLEPQEKLLQGAQRELLEETCLDLRGHQPTSGSYRFAHPKRSEKGRVITEVFVWDLDSYPLITQDISTEVQGRDDALKADWYDIYTLKRDMMHDDHYQIMKYILDRLG